MYLNVDQSHASGVMHTEIELMHLGLVCTEHLYKENLTNTLIKKTKQQQLYRILNKAGTKKYHLEFFYKQ